MQKAKPATLYVRRDVVNGKDIVAWAKEQGFNTTLTPDDMHVTLCYSKQPVDWMKAGVTWNQDEKGTVTVPPGGPRRVETFDKPGLAVLLFNNNELQWRHDQIKRDTGASWDFDQYQPHITITWDRGDIDLRHVEPYQGRIVLGPEVFEELNEGWKDNVVEKVERPFYEALAKGIIEPVMIDVPIVKVDKKLGLVFGYAIICKRNGEDYFDLNVDHGTGERVPEHIPEDAMLEAVTKFMKDHRVHKVMHDGGQEGDILFAFPLTTDIAKALGIKASTTGLLIGASPTPDVLAKYESGELRGFSIGGSRQKSRLLEEV